MRQTDLGPTSGNTKRAASSGWLAVPMALIAAVALSEPAAACAVCYGAEDSAMTAGMNNAILLLLGVVALVQGGFVALFLSFRQRARQARSQGKDLQPTHGGTP